MLRELGRGATGVVYEVQDEAGAPLALKLVIPSFTPAALERFLREGNVLSRLHHPNIVRVVDLGEADGRPFIVMELVRGGSLQERIRRTGPLEPGEALRLCADVAAAVAHAHAQQVLHRDLKPDNILLTVAGHPVLTDFGLARWLELEARLTQTGDVLGTPAYMAPEQADGRRAAVGPRSDVYAVGATLYACLTGRAPFEGSSLVNLLNAVMGQEPVPPSQLRPGLDPAIDGLVLRCLAKDPGERYLDATKLERALWSCAENLDAGPARARPVSLWPALGIVPLMVVAVVVGWSLSRGDAPPPAPPPPNAANRTETPKPTIPQRSGLSERAQRLFARGRDAVARGELRQAIAAWTEALELDPRHVEALFARALARAKLGERQQALADLNRLLQIEPDMARAYSRRGQLRTALGDPRGALADHDRAVELAPELAMVYANRAVARAQTGDDDGALRDWGRAAELAPTMSEVYIDRGVFFAQRGRRQEAIRDFTRTLELRPGYAAAAHNRGQARLEEGDFKGAVADFDLALRSRPNDPASLHGRGVAKRHLPGRIQAGIADLSRAIAINPRSAPSYFERGNARRTLGQFKLAIEDFSATIRLTPRLALAHAHRGLARAQLGGDLQGAIADLERGLQLLSKTSASREPIRKALREVRQAADRQ